MITDNSRAMHYAHILDQPHFAWSDIVRHAWYFVSLRRWLTRGVVSFSFRKQDGSLREAHGTLDLHLIPADKRPKGALPRPNFASMAFFDLDLGEWRAFDIRRFCCCTAVHRLIQLDNNAQKENKRKEPKEK